MFIKSFQCLLPKILQGKSWHKELWIWLHFEEIAGSLFLSSLFTLFLWNVDALERQARKNREKKACTPIWQIFAVELKLQRKWKYELRCFSYLTFYLWSSSQNHSWIRHFVHTCDMSQVSHKRTDCSCNIEVQCLYLSWKEHLNTLWPCCSVIIPSRQITLAVINKSTWSITHFSRGDQMKKGFRDHKCLWHNGNPLFTLKSTIYPWYQKNLKLLLSKKVYIGWSTCNDRLCTPELILIDRFPFIQGDKREKTSLPRDKSLLNCKPFTLVFELELLGLGASFHL